MALGQPKEYLKVTNGQLYDVRGGGNKQLSGYDLLSNYALSQFDMGKAGQTGGSDFGAYLLATGKSKDQYKGSAGRAALKSEALAWQGNQANVQAALQKFGLNTAEGLQNYATGYTNFYNKANSPAGVAAQEAQIKAQNAGTIGTPENPIVSGAKPQPGVAPTQTPQQNPTGNVQGTQPPAQPVGQQLNIQRDLVPGSSGEDVKGLQNFLLQQGFQIPDGPTGYYGPQTKAAVAAWQKQVGIQPKNASDFGYFGKISRSFTEGASVAPTSTQVAGAVETAPTADTESQLSLVEQEYKNHLEQKTYQQYIDTLSEESGLKFLRKQVEDTNKQLLELRNNKTEEENDINNDPWISESSRIRKLNNLDGKYSQQEANLQDAIQISQKQADDAIQEIQFIAKMEVDRQNQERQFELEVQKFKAQLAGDDKKTTDIQEYEYAKSQGYNGGLLDFQREQANLKAQAAGGGGGLTPSQINSSVNSIASGFDNEPIVKSYNTVQEGYQTIKNIGVNSKSPSDDIAFIYAFAKIQDPNSVVREGEYNTIQKYAQTWADNFGFTAKRIFSNTNFLTADAKQKMLNTLKPKVDTITNQYSQVRNEYQRQIQDAYSGKPRSITDYTAPSSNQSKVNDAYQEYLNHPTTSPKSSGFLNALKSTFGIAGFNFFK